MKYYDLFVIGGGSGGLASSKAAAKFGKRVALADFTVPGPHATTWGTGGTCVNVGCIPTKLMPYSARLGELRKAQINAGYQGINFNQHSWPTLIQAIQKHIQELNQKQESALKVHGVEFHNKFAKFIDQNTLEVQKNNNYEILNQQLTSFDGQKEIVQSKNIVICVGSRPILYQDEKLVITSEDVFSQITPPGKTLVVGASYVGLECAGFINGFGYDTTVMVRSQIMSTFDQEMANRIGEFMDEDGVKFLRGSTLTNIKQVDTRKLVTWTQGGQQFEELYDTVLYAIGRRASTSKLNLQAIGVQVNPKNNKILTDEQDRTSVTNIFAIGDCTQGSLEYTPIAVMSGRMLAKRLYDNSQEIMNYADVATTIYTPVEYGCVGLSEEKARQKHKIKVYKSEFQPLQWQFNPKKTKCLGKLIVDQETDRVIGFHYVGPEAAEVTQGFGVAIKMKARKSDFDETVPIHPSMAEEMLLMR